MLLLIYLIFTICKALRGDFIVAEEEALQVGKPVHLLYGSNLVTAEVELCERVHAAEPSDVGDHVPGQVQHPQLRQVV